MTIKIENLTFKCIIGILPFERKKEQQVIIKCKLTYKYKQNSFIDYSKIVKTIKKLMKKEKFGLIEEAIIFIKKDLYKTYKIKKIKLSICKPHIINNCKITVFH